MNKVTDEHVGPITGTHIGPVTGNMLPRSLVNILAKSPGFPTGVANMGGGSSKFDGGGLKSKHRGSMGGAKNVVEKYLRRKSFDSKVAGYKSASLQIY